MNNTLIIRIIGVLSYYYNSNYSSVEIIRIPHPPVTEGEGGNTSGVEL